MKNLWRWLIAATATVASVLVISGTALAAPMSMAQSPIAVSSQSNTVLILSIQPVLASSVNLELSAKLRSAVSGQSVTFFVQSQEFSKHGWMAVGSAVSNSLGVASYIYTPTWTGKEPFGAALGSSNAVAAPSIIKSFQVLKDPPGVPPSVVEYARPLGSIGGIFVKSLLAIIATVWIILLGSLALVIRRMPRLSGASAVDTGRSGRH